MSVKYQIEAIIDKIVLDNGQDGYFTIQLRGCGKYCFEKDKDKKEFWNVIEKLDGTEEVLKPIPLNAKIKIHGMIIGIQHLINHAFFEKKKLKFILESFTEPVTEYYIVEISHVSS